MQVTNFIGIDVSKETLDHCVVRDGQELAQGQLENNPTAIRKGLTQLMRETHATAEDTVFVLEHTGMYCIPLVKYFEKTGLRFWMESAVQIKRSLGLTRGKSDRVDAARIAMYGFRNRDAVKLTKLKRDVVERLSYLVNQRERFVQTRKQIVTPLGEQKRFLDKEVYALMESVARPVLRTLDKSIEKVEKMIRELISSDQRLHELNLQVTSVDGIGPVTAAYMIVTTNEFTDITNPRKFACHAGVAPFEHSSGSSVKGKTRVSHMANKKMKTLLHMAAMSAIQMPGELSAYYQRRKAVGKHHLSIVNAIRAKLVHRAFACVNQHRCYQKNLNYAFVNP